MLLRPDKHKNYNHANYDVMFHGCCSLLVSCMHQALQHAIHVEQICKEQSLHVRYEVNALFHCSTLKSAVC